MNRNRTLSTVLLTLGVLSLACSRKGPEGPSVTTPGPVAEAPAARGRDAAIETVAADLFARKTAVLQNELADIEARLETAEAERARLEEGLERCVAELNRVAGRTAWAFAPSASTPSARVPAPRNEGRAELVALLIPRIQIVEDRIYVNVQVINRGTADAQTTANIDLLRDGRRVDSVTEPLYLPAGSADYVSATFNLPSSDTSCSWAARVRFP